MVAQERTQQGILVVHEHEQLTRLIDMPLSSLDNLLTSRTMVCLSKQLKKNYKFNKADDSMPPSFTIPTNNIMASLEQLPWGLDSLKLVSSAFPSVL